MSEKKEMVIAIDGPSGAGKSTVARLLAARLGYTYIDTGAMYRAVGWKARRDGVDPGDEAALARLCERIDVTIRHDSGGQRVLVNGTDVTSEIRTPEMGMMASAVSRSPAVRACLLTLQRRLGVQGGVVMDGRDIGTVVFPDADKKFYLDASVEERGRRRFRELAAKGMEVDLAGITEDIRTRDLQDSSRKHAPLRKAPDARYLDSSEMKIEDVIAEMIRVVSERGD